MAAIHRNNILGGGGGGVTGRMRPHSTYLFLIMVKVRDNANFLLCIIHLINEIYSLKNRGNNWLHLRSEEISFVEEWISLDSNSSIETIFTKSTSGISYVHSIITPKAVITDVTTQGVTSVTNRVNFHSVLLLLRLLATNLLGFS